MITANSLHTFQWKHHKFELYFAEILENGSFLRNTIMKTQLMSLVPQWTLRLRRFPPLLRLLTGNHLACLSTGLVGSLITQFFLTGKRSYKWRIYEMKEDLLKCAILETRETACQQICLAHFAKCVYWVIYVFHVLRCSSQPPAVAPVRTPTISVSHM